MQRPATISAGSAMSRDFTRMNHFQRDEWTSFSLPLRFRFLRICYMGRTFTNEFVYDQHDQKCLQFPPTTPIWEVKQRLFATLPKELKDSANFGLFCPPFNGRAGKFLDDERELKDYPMPGHVGYLELKYKRRVYKMMNLDEKVLKQLHTKSNLRKFVEYILSAQCDKITKLCNKGLDPNFHDLDNGETPLTLATTLKEPVPVLVALINGGAHLDFRALDGCTPLHRAAQQNNFKALQGLLELGSSANYKDSKGLTPLYYSVTHSSNPSLCELLLHDYAMPGAVDSQGSQEIHQVCRNGYVRHLEHLIFYGADIDARNASGNTPLHVCAVNNQESCARVLLFRGADKHAKNYANQTAYHVAVIAGATILADVIKTHSSKDIVPLREKPTYNPRRRRRSQSPSSSSTISRTGSVSRLSSRSPSVSHGVGGGGVLASPSPSSRSYAMFSASGSVSSNGSHGENQSQPSDDQCSTSGVVTDKSSCSDDSTCTPQSMIHLPPNNHRMSRQQHQQQQQRILNEQPRNDRMSIYSAGSAGGSSIKSAPVRRADSAFFTDSAPQSREVSLERTTRAGVPRTVTLARGAQGFGFVLRGSKHGNLAAAREMGGMENPPALQYLDEVDRGGPADLAGLKPGDFLLSISGEDVRTYPHERAVNLIRVAQHAVTLTVLTCPQVPVRCSGYSGMSVPKPPLMKVPPPPRRDPRTSLTIGPERSRSYVGLNDIGASSYDTVGNNDASKIASIRARPSSRRITAVEIEELIERTNQGPGGVAGPAAPLSSFTPLPKSETTTPNGTASRVFSSVAHMKRQRAAVQQQQQQQRRKTEVISQPILHKDYHSTPDLSGEQGNLHHADAEEDEEEEELYSDTMYRPADVYHHVHHQNGSMGAVGAAASSLRQLPQHHQNGYHEPTRREVSHRSVPTTPQHTSNPGYARPAFGCTPEKPPLPPNRPPQQQQSHHSSSQKPHHGTLKPSYSLDERTYQQHMTGSSSSSSTVIAAHIHEAPSYAAPDDPEPDYFSDEDRVSHSSSGRGTSVTSSIPSTPAASKVQSHPHPQQQSRPPGQRMMSQPPPPPPPPVTTATGGSSFAEAIAKAAQARRDKPQTQMPHATSAPVLANGHGPGNGLRPVGNGNSNLLTTTGVTRTTVNVTAATTPPPVKQDDFQSELMRAIQRRSQEKEPAPQEGTSSRKSSSTDVDALSATATTDQVGVMAAAANGGSSVKDRIVFLERQRAAAGAVKAVRISGITNDQSSTDAADGPEVPSAGGRSVNGLTVRAGVQQQGLKFSHNNGGGDMDEGMPARYGTQTYQARSISGINGSGGGGFGRDHDSASINSQSSASTLSSGYESPTLKYGSAGEHLWSTSIPHTETHHGRKLPPGYEPVGVSLAPPPEFS
ncbi:SH3 and multiple ankyrin repeat domains protein 3 [Hypsibius exemplaris]|uniref:SH3 and multiple ankyrin repeat domains protein 3 n=1 Tax=Hypsibius exemplaris TaxID=2072580 RepID=A0A1W0WZ90_HYPEX|nr:SH3 and multiple ankyrin repeat domains protein 3 [Hypsibius exemplaris]